MKRTFALIAAVCLLVGSLPACAEDAVIRPKWRVPDYVTWLLEIAGNEVGYKAMKSFA